MKTNAENSENNSLLPKTPTGTRINKRGKNLILCAGGALGLYIVWAIFGLSPKAPVAVTSQDALTISASRLGNQQDQGQSLLTTLRSQAYGGTGAEATRPTSANLPIPAGADSITPPNLAQVTAAAAAIPTSTPSVSTQSPYQQTLQNGMQSSLTPDGFESGSGGPSSSNSGNSTANSQVEHPPGNNAISANAAAIQALATSDNQNMQSEKNQFLQSNQSPGNDTLQGGVINPVSHFMIMAGSIIPATLITGIDSDLPGSIQAIVSQNVYDSRSGNQVLIPQGSRLIGTYDSAVAYGQSRVLIVWSRVIFPNDQYIDLQGMPGADLTGFAGLTDQVDNHYFRIYGSALLMSLFSAGMQLSQPQSSSVNGSPTNQQIIAGAMGQQLGQTATEMIQKNINIQPTINIRPGDNFNVLVTRDIPFVGAYQDAIGGSHA